MKPRTKVLLCIIFFIIYSLTFFILRIAKKISTKAALLSIFGLLLAVGLYFGLRALIRSLLARKVSAPIMGLTPPPLDKDKILDGLRQYFSKEYGIPYGINHEGKLFYPQGTFALEEEDFYRPWKINYYLFQVSFLAGVLRAQTRVIVVLANQRFEEVCKGNFTKLLRTNLNEWHRRPRELPDVPIESESNMLITQVLGSMDRDYLAKNPEMLRMLTSGAGGGGDSGGQRQSLVQDQDLSDEDLAGSNVYPPRSSAPARRPTWRRR